MKDQKKNVFTMDVDVPEIVQQKADSVFSQIEKEGKLMKIKEKKSPFTNRKLIGLLAAGAACILLVCAVSLTNDRASNNLENPLEQSEDDPFAFLPDFSLTAYAAEPNIGDLKDGQLMLLNADAEDGYTGFLFRPEGEGITGINLSLDKGELYSVTMEQTTEEALKDWLAQGMPDINLDDDPDTHTIIGNVEVSGTEEAASLQTLYHCKKRGTNVTDLYKDSVYYGFYLPENLENLMNSETDLAEAYQNSLKMFEDATLTVTVNYEDGSTLTKEFSLSVRKLMQDENGEVTQQEWKSEEEGAYVYGILLSEK